MPRIGRRKPFRVYSSLSEATAARRGWTERTAEAAERETEWDEWWNSPEQVERRRISNIRNAKHQITEQIGELRKAHHQPVRIDPLGRDGFMHKSRMEFLVNALREAGASDNPRDPMPGAETFTVPADLVHALADLGDELHHDAVVEDVPAAVFVPIAATVIPADPLDESESLDPGADPVPEGAEPMRRGRGRPPKNPTV